MQIAILGTAFNQFGAQIIEGPCNFNGKSSLIECVRDNIHKRGIVAAFFVVVAGLYYYCAIPQNYDTYFMAPHAILYAYSCGNP